MHGLYLNYQKINWSLWWEPHLLRLMALVLRCDVGLWRRFYQMALFFRTIFSPHL